MSFVYLIVVFMKTNNELYCAQNFSNTFELQTIDQNQALNMMWPCEHL